MDRRRRTRLLAIVLVVSLVLGLVGGLLAATINSSTDPPAEDRAATTPTADVGSPPEQVSDLPPIPVSELPPEALETAALISSEGPFPHAQDGATFQNREGLLPDQPAGYYREFTVPTPGEDDRGARRLVVGEGGEVFYTDDHYASFREVTSG